MSTIVNIADLDNKSKLLILKSKESELLESAKNLKGKELGKVLNDIKSIRESIKKIS